MEVVIWVAVVAAVVLAVMALLGFVLSRVVVKGNARAAAARLPAKASDAIEESGAIVTDDSPVFGLLRLTRDELIFVDGPTGGDTTMPRQSIRAAAVVQQTPTGTALRNPALQVTYDHPDQGPTSVVFLVKAPADWVARLAPVAR